MRTSLFLLCLALFVWAAAGVSWAANSPQAALVQAQRGIDEARSDLFTAVVDVSSVVNRASDDLFVMLKDLAAKGELGNDNIAVLLALAASAEGGGQSALFGPLLITEVKNFVATGINGGYFAGKSDPSVSLPRNSLAASLKKMPEGRREIVPGKLLSQQDGKARMAATVTDPEAGRLPLELIVEQHKDGWRVMEIANAKELFHEVAKRNRK
jgi:hypothetical protein